MNTFLAFTSTTKNVQRAPRDTRQFFHLTLPAAFSKNKVSKLNLILSLAQVAQTQAINPKAPYS